MRDDVARLAAAKALELAKSIRSIRGPSGKDGKDGDKGERGEKGEKGDKGDQGLNGFDGRDGIDGRNGVDGRNGINGVDGKNGAKGDKGDRGEKGDKGERGPKGDPGNLGQPGQIGPMPKHEKKGLMFRFESAPGVWGSWFVVPTGGGGGGRDDKLFDRQQTIIEMTDAYKAGELGGASGGVTSFNTRTGDVTLSSVDVTGAIGFTPENAANKNAASGYAGLDATGKVAASLLPSYVDDVIEAANLASFPGMGETGKIYVAIDTGKVYRWSGSTYIEISPSPGSTDAVTEGSINLYYTNARARASISAGTGITYSLSTGVITNASPDQTVALTGAGTTSISGTYPNFTITSNDQYVGTVTSVTGTSPVASSGGATPAISLSSGYGDTQNPYASKTANYVLAAPNGSAGVPTFRAIVAADIPTLNQNTTGTASNVTGTVAVANGGTGQTSYTNGQLLIGNTTGNTLAKATLTQGNGVAITNGAGTITIASALAKTTTVVTSGSAQTYTAPANTQWVKVTVVGPGGNGGAATNQRATGGGGGGVAIKWLSMSAAQTLTYTVGNASGTASSVSSGTLVITTITANSGSNGAGTAYANSITAGGAGGTASGGDINMTGGQGGYSYGSGTTVGTNFSGAGGNCPGFGSGGAAVAVVANAGVAGNGYGAGGGGAHGSNTGANGTGGIIIFEAY